MSLTIRKAQKYLKEKYDRIKPEDMEKYTKVFFKINRGSR